MSVPRVDIRCYLPVEADELLEALATVRGQTKADVASDLLEVAILGAGHRVRVAASQLEKTGTLRKIKE